MRYVLLFSDGTITVGDHDEKSGYFVWGRKGWRAAVEQLTAMVRKRREGKITNLEIQSHGRPGTIVAPPDDITNDNVAQFGGMLRAVMASGGLIEVMACNVASFARWTFDGGTIQYSPAVMDAYFGGKEKDPVFMKKTGNRNVVTRIEDTKRLAEMKAEHDAWRKQLWSYKDNGLEFCLRLAQTSGAIVRASSLVQSEEFGDNFDTDGIHTTYTTDHFIMRDFDRFGDWDGPVWDFMPNGSVKYLGCSIPRHKLRLPVHTVMPLAFREQGGNNADVGQRPQRINRNPLPV